MELIGQAITHKIFGPGTVLDLTGDIVTIRFQDREKKFIYPDAFQRFLTLLDQEGQRRLEGQIQERDAAMRQARQTAQEEQERRKKALNFKILANSHAVFHIAPEQLERAVSRCQAFTGTYLSGYSRGLPRVAERVKPNSLCLLTTRSNGQAERERRVLGAFMAGEDFFGEDAHDGVIQGHPRYRVFLPPDAPLLFWPYFGQDAPPRWGNTAFKYCSGTAANRILAEITEQAAAFRQKEAATELYRYFCKMNQLRPLISTEEGRGDPEADGAQSRPV